MPLPLESTSFCRLEDQISFLNALTIRIPFSADLRKAILSCLHTNDLAVPIKTFINQSLQSIRGSRAQDCIQIDVCPVILFNKQKELASVICVMVLTAEMHSTVDDIERLQPKTATQFLELHGKLSAALVDSRCSVESNSSSHQGGSAPLTILEATATPGMRMSSQHWRDRLLNELCQDAHRQHAGIISAVGEICRDLERRCEDIEKPLKDEQARSQALQKEIEDAQGKHRMLEELLERKQSQIEEMEHEKETLEAQLDAALEKVHESEEKIGTLRKDVEDERKGRKDDWKLAAIERDRVAGEHLGAMAESQTRIDELEGSVSKLTEIAEGLRVELDNEKREKGHLAAELENKIRELEEKQKEVGQRNEELEELGKGIEEKLILIQEKDAFIGSMTAKITGLEKAIDESKETIAARDSVIAEKQTVVEQMGGEVKRLEDAALAKDRDIHELNQRLVRLDEAVAEFRAKTEQLRLEIEQTKASSRLQVEHLQKDHTNTVNGLKNAHEKELLTVQAQLQKTKHDWISDRESLYGEIRGWEKKFEKYQAIQERKAKEFSDAQELARKLMATMGAVNYNELIPTGSPARPARESIPVPASLRTPTRKSARRRRADALEEHQPENDMNPNSPSSPVIEPSAKRTRTKLHSVKATNTAPILENKQSTTGFKTVKSSVFHTKAVGSNYNKENMTPRAGKASKFADVRDEGSELNTRVPDDVEDSNDNGVEAGDGSEAGDTITSSSSYGETVIFTSTPKILAGNINAGVAAAHPESVDSSMEGQHYEPDDTTGGF
ncbi:hypothetical protein BDZ91DRAFT_36969 [Kalaharituber pfeilii]|nr:hypothetical protein BDZ91DRAFT_36969 [Kalaharituber pfeilii]